MTEIVKIDDKTWRIEDGFVRFFLAVGDDKAALIDSGINSADAKSIAETLTDLPIILINTHGDGDHISGTGSFSEIHMAAEDYYNMKMNELFPDTKLKEFNDGDIIDLGDRMLKIVKIPGHTKGSIAIIDVANRRIFSGDSVQSGFIFMFGNHRDPAAFEESLLKLNSISEQFDVIYPSHDAPELDKEYVGKVLECWRKVMNGNLESETITLHNTLVKAFKAEYCGFYCDNE